MACGLGSAATRSPAGTTYYVMAFSDTPGVTGGALKASFDKLPPAPTSTLTVDPRATAYKDGSMRLTGTYSCTNANGFFSDVEGTVTQQVGRVKINGGFFVSPLDCDGAVHPWEAIVTSDNGLFAGGKAANVSLVFACGDLDCSVTFADRPARPARATPHDQRRTLGVEQAVRAQFGASRSRDGEVVDELVGLLGLGGLRQGPPQGSGWRRSRPGACGLAPG